jgi:hypothetical protein
VEGSGEQQRGRVAAAAGAGAVHDMHGQQGVEGVHDDKAELEKRFATCG